MQEEVGLQSATDGEFRRESWHMDFIYQLGGISKVQDDTIHVQFHNASGEYDWAPPSRRTSTRRSRCRETIFGEEFAFLRDTVERRRRRSSRSRRRAWSTTAAAARRSTTSVYPDLDEFWADLTAAYAERGPPAGRARLHLPAARRHEPRVRQRPRASASTSREIGGDPEHQHEPYIAQHQPRARGPAGRGWRSPRTCAAATTSRSWAAEGGYDFVAEALFNELEVDGFFLRVGRRALRRLRAAALRAEGQDGRARARDDQARRSSSPRTTSSAASRRPRSTSTSTSSACRRSAASPRPCEGNDLTRDEQSAKLRLVVETAEEVWGE